MPLITPVRPVLAVSTAVVRDGRVLLAQRGRAPSAGLFSLPGGHVELGETLAEAALRELREEVGVSARLIGFNRHVEVIERDSQGAVRFHIVIATFVAAWVAGEGTPGPEATLLRWMRPDDIGSLPVTAGLMPVVVAALAMSDGRADAMPC